MYHFQKEIEEFEALIAKEVKFLHLIKLCMKKCMNINGKNSLLSILCTMVQFYCVPLSFFLFDILALLD